MRIGGPRSPTYQGGGGGGSRGGGSFRNGPPLPGAPPYKAYITNLPHAVREDDIGNFFGGLNVRCGYYCLLHVECQSCSTPSSRTAFDL